MSQVLETDQYFMKLAIQQANLAVESGEVPVGAVLVIEKTIVAKTHNQVELLRDATAHAEMLALTAAYQALGSKYLPEATLYITLEPCLMCAGAMYWSKLKRVVFGASDEKNGYNATCCKSPFHPKTEVVGGLMTDACRELMQAFFKSRR